MKRERMVVFDYDDVPRTIKIQQFEATASEKEKVVTELSGIIR